MKGWVNKPMVSKLPSTEKLEGISECSYIKMELVYVSFIFRECNSNYQFLYQLAKYIVMSYLCLVLFNDYNNFSGILNYFNKDFI